MPHHEHNPCKHDECDEHEYKKRCYCEKCVKKYDEWCRRHKKDGKPKCYRKCYTVCEIKCKKPCRKVKKYGYKKLYEGKWQHYDPKHHHEHSSSSHSDDSH